MTDQPVQPVLKPATSLVTPAWLASQLDAPHLRVLDLRLPESYADGHIPTAILISLNEWRFTRGGVEGMLIEPAPFAALMGRLGINADTLVIAYDDQAGLLASRVVWSLLAYGHQRVAMLDGGWDAWEAGQHPVSAEGLATAASFGVFIPRPVAATLADLDWVRAHQSVPGVVLLDVRAPREYQQGHIPGAVHWNWENGIGTEGTFRAADEVLAELHLLGVTPEKDIATYCHSGVRAAHTYLLLRELGFERVRMYDGSWAEWAHAHQGAS